MENNQQNQLLTKRMSALRHAIEMALTRQTAIETPDYIRGQSALGKRVENSLDQMAARLGSFARATFPTMRRTVRNWWRSRTGAQIMGWSASLIVIIVIAGPFISSLARHGIALYADIITKGFFGELPNPASKDFDETVRNLGLISLGVIGTLLAVWRSMVAQHTLTTQERGLVVDRFQSAMTYLGAGGDNDETQKTSQTQRMSALRILETLANESPQLMFEPVTYAFMDYCRSRTKDGFKALETDIDDTDEDHYHRSQWIDEMSHVNRRPSEDDVQFAIEALFRVREVGKRAVPDIEQSVLYNLRKTHFSVVELSSADLSRVLFDGGIHILFELEDCSLEGAQLGWVELHASSVKGCDLSGAHLKHAYLDRADLYGTNFSNAHLQEANLSRAVLIQANLTGADLTEANLSRANLAQANLSGAILQDVKMKGYVGLECVWAFADNPPKRAPTKVENALALRKQNEPWDVFVRRMRYEEPGSAWDRVLID